MQRDLFQMIIGLFLMERCRPPCHVTGSAVGEWLETLPPPPAGMLEVSAALGTFESQQLCGLCVSGEQESSWCSWCLAQTWSR